MEIIIKKVMKKYGDKIVLDDISISIEKGEIYALIGKNGAGKTTLMKLITGFIRPTRGEINIKSNNQNVGVLLENPGLLMNLSGYDNLKAKCICLGIKKSDYISELLTLVGLEDDAYKKVKKYSLGMKQRLGLALAMVGNPQVLVLDEPINGLDPQGIASIRSALQKINSEKNTTIIISSHILEELSKIATKYAFMDKGKILKEVKNESLLKECNDSGITIEEYYFSLIGK